MIYHTTIHGPGSAATQQTLGAQQPLGDAPPPQASTTREGVVGQLIDAVLPGQKGFAATAFLTPLANDPAQFNAHYRANKAAIDAYWRQVDFGRLTGAQSNNAVKLLSVGALAGAGVLALVNALKSRSTSDDDE